MRQANDVNSTLREFMHSRIDEPDLHDDTDIFERGIVGSLFAIELVAFIETTFSMTITVDDLDPDNFRSISALRRLILRKRGIETSP